MKKLLLGIGAAYLALVIIAFAVSLAKRDAPAGAVGETVARVRVAQSSSGDYVFSLDLTRDGDPRRRVSSGGLPGTVPFEIVDDAGVVRFRSTFEHG